MARGEGFYALYLAWFRVRFGQLGLELNEKREEGFGDSSEDELYANLKELRLIIRCLESYTVNLFTAVEVDTLIDRGIEITGTVGNIQFSVYPAVETGNLDNDSPAIAEGIFQLSTRFTDLVDTFNSYVARRGKYVKVRDDGLGLTTDDLAASQIIHTPTGSWVTATTVQAAFDEIDTTLGEFDEAIDLANTFREDIDAAGTGFIVKFANSPTSPRYSPVIFVQGDNMSITNPTGISGGAAANVTIATSMTPVFTSVETTGDLEVGGSMTVFGTVNGMDLSDENANNLKLSGGQNTMGQDIDLDNLYKVTNAAAASANGQYTVYQQVVRTASDQTGIAGIKEYSDPSVFQNAIIKDRIGAGLTVTVDSDEQMILATDYTVDGTLTNNGTVVIVA